VNAGKSQQISHKRRLIGSQAVTGRGRERREESRQTGSEIFTALYAFTTL
jgi:hypothetical protein